MKASFVKTDEKHRFRAAPRAPGDYSAHLAVAFTDQHVVQTETVSFALDAKPTD